MRNRFMRALVLGSSLALLLSSLAPVPAFTAPGGASLSAPQGESVSPVLALEQRIRRQSEHIDHALRKGLIKLPQAQEAMGKLATIKMAVMKATDGGRAPISKNDHKHMENLLNQNNDYLKSLTGAGVAVSDGPNVLGPTWKAGPDGAQDPKSLEKRLKMEERRELRQEKQATEQVQEQQQLDYEKQMTKNLGNQRRQILNKKDNLNKIRQDSGN